MEEAYETLPQHTCSWLKDGGTLFKFQGFWNRREFQGFCNTLQNYKGHPSDVLLCSFPKTGTTWLKALAFAVVTREMFGQSDNPLLKTAPHDCIPFLEKGLKHIEENHKSSEFPVKATHLPYTLLPETVIASNCKIVYIYRNIKDVLVSLYEFVRNIMNLSIEDAPFERAFDEYCQGIMAYGPYWDHILGYWKASQERPDIFLLLKYEDMKTDPINIVIRLAEFIGYPFSNEEVEGGVVENIIKFCSFENLKNLEANKTGKYRPDDVYAIENRLYFRKAEDGDWKNYFTNEMIEKIDMVIDQKLKGTNLVLK